MVTQLWLSLVVLVGCLAGPPARVAHAAADKLEGGRVVRLAADVWPPFNDVAGSSREGYMIDVARLVFAEHDCRVEYLNVAWDRAKGGTLSGLFDGAVGATPQDGKGLVFPSEELGQIRASFFVRRGSSWRFNDPASVKKIRLGVIQGYDYCPWLNDWIAAQAGNPAKIQSISGSDALSSNLKKLLAGRVDAVVDHEAVLRHAARQLGLEDQFVLAGTDRWSTTCSIAFTPATPRGRILATWLSQGIAELRADGRLDSLLARYGLQDWRAGGSRRGRP